MPDNNQCPNENPDGKYEDNSGSHRNFSSCQHYDKCINGNQLVPVKIIVYLSKEVRILTRVINATLVPPKV